MSHQVTDFTHRSVPQPHRTGCTVFRTIYPEPGQRILKQTANDALTSFDKGGNYEPMEKTQS
jgi:hypothetical protein